MKWLVRIVVICIAVLSVFTLLYITRKPPNVGVVSDASWLLGGW